MFGWQRMREPPAVQRWSLVDDSVLSNARAEFKEKEQCWDGTHDERDKAMFFGGLFAT